MTRMEARAIMARIGHEVIPLSIMRQAAERLTDDQTTLPFSVARGMHPVRNRTWAQAAFHGLWHFDHIEGLGLEAFGHPDEAFLGERPHDDDFVIESADPETGIVVMVRGADDARLSMPHEQAALVAQHLRRGLWVAGRIQPDDES